MAASTITRPGRYIWPIAPALCVLVGILLSLLPYGLDGWLVSPAFALIPLYYWAINRPNLLPVWLVFALGLVQDLASGGPLGIWAVVFLAMYSLTLSQRDGLASLRLRLAWPVFGGLTLAGELTGWFAGSIYHAGFISAGPVLSQTLTTMLVLPLFVPVLIFLEREMSAALRQH